MSGLSLEIIDNECEIDELCRSSIELVEHIRNFFLVYKDRLSVLLFRKFAIEKKDCRKCRFLQYAAVLYLLIEQAIIDETDNL